MRDQIPETFNDSYLNIIVNLLPTHGTDWVLVCRSGMNIDSSGVETTANFLRDYSDLGFKES